MRYVTVLLILVSLYGCAAEDVLRKESSKMFDEVTYTYSRKGNIVHRELMAIGDQKVNLDDNLTVPAK